MKNIVKRSVIAMAALTGATSVASANSIKNLENPLYMPTAGEVYAKLSAGVMYKKADDSLAMQAKGQARHEEWPIWRAGADLGVGITDFLSVRGQFQYTDDATIDRKGLNNGRLGLNFRASEFLPTQGWVWDIYADAQLGGISRMNADLVASKDPLVVNDVATRPLSFNYDNYSNGRWGGWLGTQVGKTWGKFTGAAWAEVGYTVGNDNNKITITPSGNTRVAEVIAYQMFTSPLPFTMSEAAQVGGAFITGLPDSFSVNTKSAWEYNLGLKSLYEIDQKWSVGASFTYKNRATNRIEKVNANVDAATINAALASLGAPITTYLGMGGITAETMTSGVMDEFLGSMHDGIQEYILSAVVARQLNNAIQVSVYAEYTFDDAEKYSQNGTDIKAELGVRLNARF